MPSNGAVIFKIATQCAWDEACRIGTYAGSADDVRDGFIHLSAGHQLHATAAKHFRGVADLVLIAIDANRLGASLKWETSCGGDLFPHVYGALPTSAALWTRPLPLGEDGVPQVAGDLETC